MSKLPGPDDLKSVSELPDSDDLKIDLDEWHEQAQNDDPVEIADSDLLAAADFLAVMLEDEKHPLLSSTDIMRKHPELVASHALAHGISRIEVTYRILKVEELRLLKSIKEIGRAHV